MVVYGHLFLLKINIHLGNLLFCGHLLIPLPLLSHLENLNLVDVIVIVEVVFGSVDSVRFILDKCHSSAHNFVIPVFVELGGFLADALYSFDETVVVSVGVVCYYAHAAVDLDNLLPVRQFAWTVVLNRLEFVGVSVSSLELVTSVLVEVAIFLHSQLFIVLHS